MPLRVNTINSKSGSNITINANVSLPSNGTFIIPKGTTAERPINPDNGAIRFNTTNNWIEFNVSNNWYRLNATVA